MTTQDKLADALRDIQQYLQMTAPSPDCGHLLQITVDALAEHDAHEVEKAKPDGDYVLVPRVPTEAMELANGTCKFQQGQEWLREDARKTWTAMIVAAPDAPAPVQGVACDAAAVERALAYLAFQEDGAQWPDAYSKDEQDMEREKMRGVLAAANNTSGPGAYCRACQSVGMRNCQHFDECSGATCITCHRSLNTHPPVPANPPAPEPQGDRDIEQRARELLAFEYERVGSTRIGEELRTLRLENMGDKEVARAVRAVMAALQHEPITLDQNDIWTCPLPEHWLAAIVELYGSEAEDLTMLEQRARELAQEGSDGRAMPNLQARRL